MKKYLKIAAIIAVVAIFIGTIIFLWSTTRPEIVTYELVSPKRDTIITTTVATGSILPRDEVMIKPQISGIISEVYCEAGDMVKVGDVLALVKVIPEMGQLNSAESRVNQATISHEQSKRNYARVKALYEKGVATLEELEGVTDAQAKAMEEMDNARKNLEIVEKGAVSGSRNLGNTQIRATITGTLLDVPIKVGNSVIQANTFNDGTTIATIADLNDMLFEGDLDESEIDKISMGVETKITIGAIQGVELDGAIEYIAPKSQDKNGVVVFPIKAAIEIPDSLYIRAGYSANAEVVTAKVEGVLSIPERFVTYEKGKTYVEILTSEEENTEEQIFEKREVKLALSDGVTIEVKSGLSEGDKIKGSQNQSKK